MSTPDYMDKIRRVAEQGAAQPLGQQLAVAWEVLESCARTYSWDVLREHYSASLREYIRDLLALLYRLPGADPVKDCEELRQKNAEYGGSWHRRGGAGAFMMLARKWDRVEQQLANHGGDLWVALKKSLNTSEGLHDTLGDLRRYLILVEAWHVARDSPQVMTAADVGEAVFAHVGKEPAEEDKDVPF